MNNPKKNSFSIDAGIILGRYAFLPPLFACGIAQTFSDIIINERPNP